MSDYVEPFRLRTLLAAYALLVCASVVAAQEPLTPEQWREDLRHMAEQMPREHKNLYHTMTETEFLKAVQELDAQIPTLERHEIIVGLARIVAMVRDGHTGIKGFVPDQGVGFRSYPIRLYAYEEGLFVQEAHREFADMLGGKVVRIGSVSTAEAVEIVGKLVSRDNDMGLTSRAPYYLASPELLHAVGIIDDMEAATFVVEREGRRETFVLSPLSSTRPRLQRGFFEDVPDWIDVRDNANAVPLWLQHLDVPYWFEYMEPEKTVYVQYSECVNSGDETVAEFFDRVSAFVESTDVNRFILDLRLNGGGTSDPNTSIVLSIIKSKIDQPGKFFVIIGRRTFSAAQNLVNKLDKET